MRLCVHNVRCDCLYNLVKLNVNDARFKNKVKVIKVNIHYTVQKGDKGCVIHIHNYLKYVLQLVLSIFSIFTKKIVIVL